MNQYVSNGTDITGELRWMVTLVGTVVPALGRRYQRYQSYKYISVGATVLQVQVHRLWSYGTTFAGESVQRYHRYGAEATVRTGTENHRINYRSLLL